MWTNIKRYMPKIIFQKKNSKNEILNHLYIGPKSFSGGLLSGVLASAFLTFCHRPTMVADIKGFILSKVAGLQLENLLKNKLFH